MICGQRLVAGSYSNSYRLCYPTILAAAILLVLQLLMAVADERAAPSLIDHALPAAEDGDLASEVVELDESALNSLGIAPEHALLVVLAAKGGPAENAGIKSGDVVFALNGHSVPGLGEFTAAVKRAGSGGEVRIGVWRGGEITTFLVRLGGTSGAVRSANIEQKIEAYTEIGKVFDKGHFPAIWGFIQYKLGELYWIRTEGRSEDNLETAIAIYNSALTVLTREAFPQQWARTQHYLALAYMDRVRGSHAENLEGAIRGNMAALTVLTRERYPREWAEIQNCLGLAYMDRIDGSRRDNVDAAIEAFTTALMVLTKEAFPEDWARIQKHLGRAYQSRLRGERTENLEAAVNAYEAALKVSSQTVYSPPAAINQPPQEASVAATGSPQAASVPTEEAAQTDQKQPAGRQAGKGSPAQSESPKNNNRRARGETPKIRAYEAKMKAKCGGLIVWMDRENNAHRPGAHGYGQRPGWFACQEDRRAR